MTTMLDDVLKSVVQALKDKGMWDNTLFIFSSDVRIITRHADRSYATLTVSQMSFIDFSQLSRTEGPLEQMPTVAPTIRFVGVSAFSVSSHSTYAS